MNWRDERIGFQIEQALAHVQLSRGCEVEVVVYDRSVMLFASLNYISELDAILDALKYVPGMRDIGLDVSVAGPVFLRKNRRHGENIEGTDGSFGVG